jgi:hypothetical protein
MHAVLQIDWLTPRAVLVGALVLCSGVLAVADHDLLDAQQARIT